MQKFKVKFEKIHEHQAKEMLDNIDNLTLTKEQLIRLSNFDKNGVIRQKMYEYYSDERDKYNKTNKNKVNNLISYTCLLIYCNFTYQNEDSYSAWINEIINLSNELTLRKVKYFSLIYAIKDIFIKICKCYDANSIYNTILPKFEEEINYNEFFYIDVDILNNKIIPYFIKIVSKELIDIIPRFQDNKEELSTYLHDLINRSKQLK